MLKYLQLHYHENQRKQYWNAWKGLFNEIQTEKNKTEQSVKAMHNFKNLRIFR